MKYFTWKRAGNTGSDCPSWPVCYDQLIKSWFCSVLQDGAVCVAGCNSFLHIHALYCCFPKICSQHNPNGHSATDRGRDDDMLYRRRVVSCPSLASFKPTQKHSRGNEMERKRRSKETHRVRHSKRAKRLVMEENWKRKIYTTNMRGKEKRWVRTKLDESSEVGRRENWGNNGGVGDEGGRKGRRVEEENEGHKSLREEKT